LPQNTNHVTEANSWILDFAKIRLRTVPLVLVDHQAQLLSFLGNLEGQGFWDKILHGIKYSGCRPHTIHLKYCCGQNI